MSNINKEELMRGLSDSQVNKSKQDFGTNALAKKETESLWSMFIGAFDDIWIKVLCAALAWSLLQVAQGAALSNKLVRAGRSMQSGVFFITQSSSDLLDEKIKNNIGLKFAFHSTDKTESGIH